MAVSRKKKQKRQNLIKNGILLVLTVITAVPLYITLINAFKPTAEITKSPLSLPLPPTLENMVSVIRNPNVHLGEMYFNSVCIAVFGMTGCIIVSALAGFYLAREASRLSHNLLIYCICTTGYLVQGNKFPWHIAGTDSGVYFGQYLLFCFYVSGIYTDNPHRTGRGSHTGWSQPVPDLFQGNITADQAVHNDCCYFYRTVDVE